MTQKYPPRRGIPTLYNSVQFRSRLEAKWAALFDMCGWRWEYEPLDLAGHIPDFILHLDRQVILECKPVTTVEELVPHQERLEVAAAEWLGQGTSSAHHEGFVQLVQMVDVDDEVTLGTIDGLLALVDLHAPRHAVVVGAQPAIVGDALTLDGNHEFTACGDHVGLQSKARPVVDVNIPYPPCLVCGVTTAAPAIPSSTMLAKWREASNAVQWKRPTP